jgi:hypothetical protein
MHFRIHGVQAVYIDKRRWTVLYGSLKTLCQGSSLGLVQRLPTAPFYLMLRKEYFDFLRRDSHAVHYIFKRGERGVCTLVLCRLATVMSCIDPFLRIVTKSPNVGHSPSLWFSIYPGIAYAQIAHPLFHCCGSVTFWYGSGSLDPSLWLTESDPASHLASAPAIFVSGLQDSN